MQRTPYDFVFMDVCMPEMDGLEATQGVRAGAAVGVMTVSSRRDALHGNARRVSHGVRHAGCA